MDLDKDILIHFDDVHHKANPENCHTNLSVFKMFDQHLFVFPAHFC